MDQEVAELASVAATVVVKSLTTAVWEGAANGLGRLWRRVHPEQAETVRAELAEGRAEVVAAAGDEQVEEALVGEWRGRLRRLLATDPGVAGELRQLVAELRSALGEAEALPAGAVTMIVTASGRSLVNQAGRDLHISTGR